MISYYGEDSIEHPATLIPIGLMGKWILQKDSDMIE